MYSLRAGAFGPTSMACQALSHFGKSRKAMAFCAGVSTLYSTAEHGSRCGGSRRAWRSSCTRRGAPYNTGSLTRAVSLCHVAVPVGDGAGVHRHIGKAPLAPPWRDDLLH